MFCISMYSEGISTKLHQHYMTKCSYMLKLIIFLSWLYIPDFRMFCISMYSEGINTKLHLDLRASIDPQIDHFLSWLYIQDFRMFCISMYSEGINTKLHQHYKTKCTS